MSFTSLKLEKSVKIIGSIADFQCDIQIHTVTTSHYNIAVCSSIWDYVHFLIEQAHGNDKLQKCHFLITTCITNEIALILLIWSCYNWLDLSLIVKMFYVTMAVVKGMFALKCILLLWHLSRTCLLWNVFCYYVNCQGHVCCEM